MLNLRLWLNEQGLSVMDLAQRLDAPLPTVEDWVYHGTTPSAAYMSLLAEFVNAECKHHWVIATANGPVSEGVCQRCGGEREFSNSAEVMWNPARPKSTDAATKVKES